MHAHTGLGKDAIMQRIMVQNVRPVFPPGTPPEFAELAGSCMLRQVR